MSDRTLRRYLLRELAPGEEARVERAYLESERLYRRLERIEDHLVDDYVRANLSATDERAFREAYLTSAERQRRVAFKRALMKVADGSGIGDADDPVTLSPRRLQLRLGVAVLLLSLGVTSYWLRYNIVLVTLELPQDSPTRGASDGSVTRVASLARSVRFTVPGLDDGTVRYFLTLDAEEGRIMTIEDTGNRPLSFDVPSSSLATGTYELVIVTRSPGTAERSQRIRFDIIKGGL